MAKLGIDRSQSVGHIQEQVFFPLFVQCKRVNLTKPILNFLHYMSTSVHPIIVFIRRNITEPSEFHLLNFTVNACNQCANYSNFISGFARACNDVKLSQSL